VELQRFLEVLPKIGTQPLAILAYICLVGGWLLWFFRKRQSADFLKALEAIPRNERTRFAQQAGYRYNDLAQLSHSDRLSLLTRRYRLLAYIATLVALVLIVLSIIITAKETGNTRVSQNLSVGRDMLVNAPGGVINTGQGSIAVTNIQGISKEEFRSLTKELDVTESALRSFFKILEQQRVPPEDLDSKLREIAASYTRLQAQLQQFLSEDPTVIALRREASQALEAGDFAQVETLLRQAYERDRQAIQEQQVSLKKRQLSAAATRAELGALKNLQLAYADAATQYRDAAAVVPQEEALTQAEYLNEEGRAWQAAGQYADAQPPLEHALALREKALGPEHPNVAASLNNLAELYRAQGRYADAEPRYQRALIIWEKALGPEHPNVATVRKNYAALLRANNRDAEAERFEAQWSAHQPPRAWLGIQMKRSSEPPGLFVEQVIAESPAAYAGIQPHDVIVRFNAQEVPDPETLLRLLGEAAIGKAVDVEIIHDGQRRTIPVTLEQRSLPRP
jgi:tetratricopeptide (TPR) repeat protein